MADLRHFGNTSNLVRFVLKNATTGVGLTGLTSASSGLVISTVADDEATATAYTVAGSTVESITTLGTFAAPTATKCRFKEVDATNHKGLYEFQFADARFAVTNARRVVISVTGAANLLDADYEIQLTQFDPYDAVRHGMTALPNANANASGGLPTVGTGSGQLNPDGTGAVPIAFGTAQPASPTANTTGSAIAYLNGKVGRTGTAQGGTASTITLDSGASATNDAFKDHSVKLTGGTGSGQFATITGYVGSTKVATIWRPSAGNTWTTTPDNTTTFLIELVPGMDLLPAQVANLTGNIIGNLSGSVGSVSGAVVLPTAPTDWLTAAAVKADAVTKIQAGLATPTNITGGVITTVTTLANLPAIPAGWLTATGIAAAALNGKGDWSTATPLTTLGATAPAGWINTAAFASGATLPAVTTLTTYTGNTPQTADVSTVGSTLLSAINGVAAAVWAVGARTLTAFGFTPTVSPVTLATSQPNYAPAKAGDAMALNLSQTGLTPRALDTIADGALTVGDALVAAVCGAAGKETVVGTIYAVKSPSTGTVIRVFTLDSATSPTSRS